MDTSFGRLNDDGTRKATPREGQVPPLARIAVRSCAVVRGERAVAASEVVGRQGQRFAVQDKYYYKWGATQQTQPTRAQPNDNTSWWFPKTEVKPRRKN